MWRPCPCQRTEDTGVLCVHERTGKIQGSIETRNLRSRGSIKAVEYPTRMVRILFSLCLVLANAWCSTACTLSSCEPNTHKESNLPPCHKAPPGHSETPDGHSHQGTCVLPMVSLAAHLSHSQTGQVAHFVDQGIPSYSLVSPLANWTLYSLHDAYHPTPPLRPRAAAILRI